MANREEVLNLVRNGVRCPESAKSCDDCQYHSTKYPMHCDEEAALVDMLIAYGVTIPVRCKDCEYCGRYTSAVGTEYWGCNWIPSEYHVVDADHYCSYGKRRTE